MHATQSAHEMTDGVLLPPTQLSEFAMIDVLREQVRTIAVTIESLSGRRFAYDVLVSRCVRVCTAHTHTCSARWRIQPPTNRHVSLIQIKLLVSIEYVGCIQFSVSMQHSY
jgi:hypothetical protein